MRMVTVVLLRRGGGAGTDGEAHLVDELLRSHAVPEHGVERLRVRPAPEGIGAVVFVRAATEVRALISVRALLAVAHAPLHAFGYTVAAVRTGSPLSGSLAQQAS
ncbi:hypothetical protein GCM10020229_02850 [Kitasatospora albolonga]|uniref:hypothetical protein n=1 Tax=Kitasatospora albolonga TaxID=68173 RepID=UPI0031E9A5BD